MKAALIIFAGVLPMLTAPFYNVTAFSVSVVISLAILFTVTDWSKDRPSHHDVGGGK